MSQVTYTQEQVEAMIAEALRKKSNKVTTFRHNAGEFVTKKGEKRAFANIKIEGNFYPTSLSYSAAEAILANLDEFRKVVAAKPVVKAEAPTALGGTVAAPRLAPAK